MHNPTIQHFGEVTSTMDVARQLYDNGAGDGTVVLADFQTKGRGRPGRTWIAEKGKNNFLATLILKTGSIPTNVLSFVISLSIIETIKYHDVPDLHLKWPNDILLRKKKLGGILIEKIDDDVFAIGIGLNFEYSPHSTDQSFLVSNNHPDGILFPPTSLKAEGLDNKIPSREVFVNKLFEHINKHEASYIENGFSMIREQWLSHHLPIGSKISFKPTQTRLHGLFNGITVDGHLILLLDDGTSKTFASGDVFL